MTTSGHKATTSDTRRPRGRGGRAPRPNGRRVGGGERAPKAAANSGVSAANGISGEGRANPRAGASAGANLRKGEAEQGRAARAAGEAAGEKQRKGEAEQGRTAPRAFVRGLGRMFWRVAGWRVAGGGLAGNSPAAVGGGRGRGGGKGDLFEVFV